MNYLSDELSKEIFSLLSMNPADYDWEYCELVKMLDNFIINLKSQLNPNEKTIEDLSHFVKFLNLPTKRSLNVRF